MISARRQKRSTTSRPGRLGDHSSELSTYFYVDAVPSQRPSPASCYIDVTRASCPGFPSAHDVSGLSAPTPNLYVCASIRTVQTHTIIIVSGPSCGSLTLIYSWTVQLTARLCYTRRTGSARLVLNTCRVFQRGCSRRSSLSSVRVL